MKKRDFNDLKNKSTKDLAKKVQDLKRELTEAILELKMGKTKNVHEANAKRKDIAKIKTLLKLKCFEKPDVSKVEKEK